MPPKPPLCPAYSAAQTLTLTTIPEDLYSPLRPHEQAVFDNWAWSTVLSPPQQSITNFSLLSSQQPNRLEHLASQFKKIGAAKRPSPPPYLPVLSKEGNGLGFVFTEDNTVNYPIAAPLQTWLQDRLEAEQIREDFEKEACAATEALRETDTGTEAVMREEKKGGAVPVLQPIVGAQAKTLLSTPKAMKQKHSKVDLIAAENSSPRNNIFSPTGRILGISATLFAPTLGKRKSGNMAERNRLSFDAKRTRRSSLSSLSITQLDKVTPLFGAAVLNGCTGTSINASDSSKNTSSSLASREEQEGANTRSAATVSQKRSLRRTVSSFFIS